MNTDNPQNERETVDEELGIFSPERYKQALWDLTLEELREECFKQYEMSGEMLSKYRTYYQKSEDYRKQRDEEKRNVSRWQGLTFVAQSALHEAVERFGAIQITMQESEGYTHNALVIVRRLVHGIAQNASDKCKVALTKIQKNTETDISSTFDLPF